MKPQRIKAKLVELGITQRSIAAELEVSESAVSRVISGKCHSARIMNKVVARITAKEATLARRAA